MTIEVISLLGVSLQVTIHDLYTIGMQKQEICGIIAKALQLIQEYPSKSRLCIHPTLLSDALLKHVQSIHV